ncbi:hypothetical protein HPP92_022118 [Vanilla planifolia]|uniref:Uncharacterized protein n=1 Tax=Vanilla planifolia TaxID=51239 RepID=A0A835UD72_VANPL|nr:hypothetical protein HPP92_022424 [Vanilla planifolia]KAG0458990.1 hypothetical protein HPP92_022118 [Vanilla planifolia]
MALSLSHAVFCSATMKLPRISPSFHRRKPASNIVAMSSLPQPSLSTADADVAPHLLRHIRSPSPSIISTVQGFLSATPPTIAPALCLAACALVRSSPQVALDTACALHLAHVHSAVISRRHLTGLSSPVELMTSDGLMVLMYEMITRSEADAGRLQRVVVEVAGAVAAIVAEVAEGAEKEDGRLPACGAACGAILGGGTEEEVERTRRMGMHMGRAHAAAMRCGVAAAADGLGMVELELEWFDGDIADHVKDFLRTKMSFPHDVTI